ncbi:hypothetical protein DXG01_008873 [Tephrocybe rancida]|nr:hypothetical protein DXG01_008873 [Tephrocybe rancida]
MCSESKLIKDREMNSTNHYQQRALSSVSGGFANHLERGIASAAAIHPLAPGDGLPLHVAEVSPDDLPIVSIGDSKVVIGCETRTWSRLRRFRTDPCSLQLFHLLSHTEGSGGASFLVDGFYAASVLKDVHPEACEVLPKVHVPAHPAGEPSVTYRPNPPTGYPVLGHDPVTGELSQVWWNNDDRSAMNHLDPRLVDEWFALSP